MRAVRACARSSCGAWAYACYGGVRAPGDAHARVGFLVLDRDLAGRAVRPSYMRGSRVRARSPHGAW
eukprot:2918873-Pleurochrysis_carterae.AAC.1